MRDFWIKNCEEDEYWDGLLGSSRFILLQVLEITKAKLLGSVFGIDAKVFAQ